MMMIIKLKRKDGKTIEPKGIAEASN